MISNPKNFGCKVTNFYSHEQIKCAKKRQTLHTIGVIVHILHTFGTYFQHLSAYFPLYIYIIMVYDMCNIVCGIYDYGVWLIYI